MLALTVILLTITHIMPVCCLGVSKAVLFCYKFCLHKKPGVKEDAILQAVFCRDDSSRFYVSVIEREILAQQWYAVQSRVTCV